MRTENTCWLADNTMNTFEKHENYVGGLRDCGGVSPLCTALPNSAFPGNDAQESDEAWPTGLVPPKLQCWPRDANNEFVACFNEITVLDDSSQGWAGKCMGLEEKTDLHSEATCEEQCRWLPPSECNVWQE